jgi:hypothetical protein
MLPRQRKGGIGMVEGRRAPSAGGMANRTILAESLRDMIGVGDRLKICLVTVVTTSRSPGET